ncbi:MAG: septum formation initiator family protein [Rikenellaceae bacterium]
MSAKKKATRKEVFWVLTAIVMAPILYVIVQNIGHSFSLTRQIIDLNREAAGYQKQIVGDSLLLERIKTSEGLEEYAREKYFMQRQGEMVFIVE